MKDWKVERMTADDSKSANDAKKKLIECYSGKSDPYKEYYYISKLAALGHIPSMKTLDIMKQDGVGCDKQV